MSEHKLYHLIHDGITLKDGLESLAESIRREAQRTNAGDPWVSYGLLSDALRWAKKLDAVCTTLENMYLGESIARDAVEYVEEGFLDEEVAA